MVYEYDDCDLYNIMPSKGHAKDQSSYLSNVPNIEILF